MLLLLRHGCNEYERLVIGRLWWGATLSEMICEMICTPITAVPPTDSSAILSKQCILVQVASIVLQSSLLAISTAAANRHQCGQQQHKKVLCLPNKLPSPIYLCCHVLQLVRHWLYEQALPWGCHAQPGGCQQQHTDPHQPRPDLDVQSQLLQRPCWAQAGRQPSWQPHSSSSSSCQERVRSSCPWLSAGAAAALIPVCPAHAAAAGHKHPARQSQQQRSPAATKQKP